MAGAEPPWETLGWAALKQRDWTAAERAFEALRSSDPLGAAFGLGYVYTHRGQFNRARAAFQAVLADAVVRNDPVMEHVSVHQLGMVEREASDLDAALTLFKREHTLITDLGGPALAVSVNAYELGSIALLSGRLIDADGHFQVALTAALASGDVVALACAWRGRGMWHLANHDRAAAGADLARAAQLFRSVDDDLSAQEALALLL